MLTQGLAVFGGYWSWVGSVESTLDDPVWLEDTSVYEDLCCCPLETPDQRSGGVLNVTSPRSKEVEMAPRLLCDLIRSGV